MECQEREGLGRWDVGAPESAWRLGLPAGLALSGHPVPGCTVPPLLGTGMVPVSEAPQELPGGLHT